MKQLDIIVLATLLALVGVIIYAFLQIKQINNIPCAEGWERTKTTCVR